MVQQEKNSHNEIIQHQTAGQQGTDQPADVQDSDKGKNFAAALWLRLRTMSKRQLLHILFAILLTIGWIAMLITGLIK